MKKTQPWFQNLKHHLFQSVVSGVIFVLTVVSLGALFVYATVLPGFQKIDDDQLLTFDEWKETVEHLFWKKSSAGGIKYEGNIEVGGGVKVGTMTTTCSASNAGMLKYTSNCMSYCNGSSWINISCITYSWSTSSYGSCSASCGGGTQTRTVICKGSDGSTVADSYCSGTKPAASQSCNTQVCPTNGSCGSANGIAVTSYPTASHCSAGTKVDVDTVATDGTYNWTCNGSNGGTAASCQANKTAPVNGVCGSANGSSVTSVPTSNLCSVGTTSTVSGSGPRNWTCAGLNGGSTASCLANKLVLQWKLNTSDLNDSLYEADIQAGYNAIVECHYYTPGTTQRTNNCGTYSNTPQYPSQPTIAPTSIGQIANSTVITWTAAICDYANCGPNYYVHRINGEGTVWREAVSV